MSLKKIIEPAGFKYLPWILLAVGLYLAAIVL
jgi:hypothetical protein